jgi:hypothetical protein
LLELLIATVAYARDARHACSLSSKQHVHAAHVQQLPHYYYARAYGYSWRLMVLAAAEWDVLRLSAWLNHQGCSWSSVVGLHGKAVHTSLYIDLQNMALLQGLHLQTLLASQERHVPAGQTARTTTQGQEQKQQHQQQRQTRALLTHKQGT